MLPIIELRFNFAKNLPNPLGLGCRFLCQVSARAELCCRLGPDWLLAVLFRLYLNRVKKALQGEATLGFVVSLLSRVSLHPCSDD